MSARYVVYLTAFGNDSNDEWYKLGDSQLKKQNSGHIATAYPEIKTNVVQAGFFTGELGYTEVWINGSDKKVTGHIYLGYLLK